MGKFILRTALWLIGFTFAAAVAPVAAIVAAISIIGLPIAVILVFLPAVMALAAVGDLTRQALPGWPAPKAAFAGVAVFLVAGMVYALAFTMQARGEARSLVAGDFDRQEATPAIRTLAFVRVDKNASSEHRQLGCDDVCYAYLVNSPQNRFVSASVPGFDLWTDEKSPGATLFRRAASGSCADEIGGRRSAHSFLKGRASSRADSAAGALLSQLERSGACLVAMEARLDAADAVIVEGVVSEGVSGYAAGIDPFADTLRAERIAIFLRRDGKLQEAVRRTNVSAYALFPVMAPIVVTGYGMNAKTGFFRPQIGDGARGGDWHAIKKEIRNRVGIAAE